MDMKMNEIDQKRRQILRNDIYKNDPWNAPVARKGDFRVSHNKSNHRSSRSLLSNSGELAPYNSLNESDFQRQQFNLSQGS